MPWTVDNPPPPAKNWSVEEKRKCVNAANAVLREGGSEEDAIFACINAAGRSKEMEIEVDTGERENAQIVYKIPLGVTSFSDVDEFVKSQDTEERILETTRQFRDLSWNILHNEKIEDKASELITLVDELDVRLTDALKETESDKSIFKTVKEMIVGKSAIEKVEDVPEEHSQLFFWKEGDRYRFMTIYTNKYRDDDLPPEILAEASHEQFAKDVEEGNLPYPKLLHFHVPGTEWGQTDWLHYDKETGFMLASGFVDRGHEKEAEAIIEMGDEIKTSHGLMVFGRDKEDETIITRYSTLEISDLPAEAAANQLTGFSILKEATMSIPDEKKQYLLKVGLSEETIAGIESDLDSKAKDAEEAGLEFKETEIAPAEDIVEEEVIEKPEGEIEEPTEPQPVTREEVAKAIVEVVAPLQEKVEAIAKGVETVVKEDEKKIAEAAKDTPAASIAALVAREWRSVGSEKAKIDDDAEIKGPEETPHDKEITGIPWIDKMISEE